ncbi:helix-turn-helix transcriptional regulator [Streptomyces thermodiastaticus]|uniref:helix-turn-helix transcriptional regulator n=1 Tax=Streptomyces thermodiastaticus TaxID=44061 RepID=UPI001671DA94|nr:LuxR C-terminal-related transcriptional regulator [Streptomyces thermodiastaticus]MCE7551650.1 LuxR C-terminal-related transcriptional regulator [Streptomyces thermodiastaticus]GHF92586.1 transcriptional regulator [Streptomyces thermodiastaticus]
MTDLPHLDEETLEVYRAFLFHDGQDPHELAGLADSDHYGVKTAIARLIDLSLLVASKDSPGGLRAVHPSYGMRVLLQREQKELARRQHCIQHNTTVLDAIAAEYAAARKSAHADSIERLHNSDDIRTRLEALAESCRHEVLAFHLAGGLTEESVEDSRSLSERAVARGVRFRSIYIDSSMHDRVIRSHAQWMVEHNCEVRTAPSLPMRLLIVDTTAAVVSGLPGQGTASALLFSSRPVVLAMRALFEAYWEHADRFPHEVAPCLTLPDEITPQERKLLELLANGLTDSAVARTLGISVRTERRKMAELMKRLGASSRFAAGVEATRRKWI